MEPSETEQLIYVMDTSGWISIENHPAQNRILYRIFELIRAGRLQCPPEVWDELKRCDWVLAWIGKERANIVRSETDVTYLQLIGDVFFRFPNMCATRGSKDKADGYVVAMAAFGNATTNPHRWVVVTSETSASRPTRKIPNACGYYGVECIGLIKMMEREFPNDRW